MTGRFFPLYFLVGFYFLGPFGSSQAQTASPSLQEIPASQGQAWAQSIQTFEAAVSQQAGDLTKNQESRAKLHEEISKLEVKTNSLRNQNSQNLFDQLRLKKLLGDLQDRLEAQSALEQFWRQNLDSFEQKSLSLLSLYNEEIERQMDLAADGASENHLNSLIGIVRKREALQNLINRFPEASADEKMPPLSLLEKSDDRDLASLETTLDILNQREKELLEKIEKSDLREAELNQEITLQSKMKDLLSDVRKMNEDSSFPRESLNRGDLRTLESQAQDSNFQREIQNGQKQKAQNQIDLIQVRQYIQVVQSEIQNLKGRASK
jgi:hypothetical protein